MKKTYQLAFVTASILLLIGTYADLPLSLALYEPGSLFGKFFALAGMIPLWTFAATSSGLMFGAIIMQVENLNKIGRTITITLFVFGVYSTYKRTIGSYHSRHLNGMPPQILVLIVISAFILSTYLGAYASRKNFKAVLIAAMVGIVSVVGGRLVVNLLKEIWGRQRFWTMSDPFFQFTEWYLPLLPSAERLHEMGDKILSFPSGHSFGGISVIWLSMFPSFLVFKKKKKDVWTLGIIIFALMFWLSTALSRIILGEHFLSDTAASAVIFLSIFILSNMTFRYIFPKIQSRR